MSSPAPSAGGPPSEPTPPPDAAVPPALPRPAFRGPGTFRALRHRNYRLYFLGQMVSLLGTFVQATALSWLSWELTHESKWPALMVVAQALPAFFLGPLGGTLADRWPKRRLIFWT